VSGLSFSGDGRCFCQSVEQIHGDARCCGHRVTSKSEGCDSTGREKSEEVSRIFDLRIAAWVQARHDSQGAAITTTCRCILGCHKLKSINGLAIKQQISLEMG